MSGCKFINKLNKLRKSSSDSIDNVDSFDGFKEYMHVVRDAEKDYGLRIPKERYLIGYEGYKKGSV